MNDIITANGNTSIAAGQAITAELFTRWTAYIDAKPRTVETYTRNIKPFMLYLQANSISQPTREDIIAYRDQLKADHKPATVQAYIMATKLFFQWLEQEHIYPDIAKHVKGAKLDTDHKKDPLTAKQVGKVLKTIDTDTLTGLRDYAIIALDVTSGLRTIEISRANIEDMRTVGDFTALFIQGKGHDEKSTFVKIPEQVEEAIRAYLAARGKTNGKDPLFVSHANRNNGERMTTRSISRIIKDNLKAAGYDSDRLTAHSLRHTAATLNLLNGASLEETQQLLRHTSINTTMIYAHALERAKNNSEERIAAAIFG
jgi:integrase/recombinase XerC